MPGRGQREPRLVGDRGALHQLGDAEVEQLGVVRIVADAHQQDVVGLDVAVDEAAVVRRAERVERLARDVEHARRRERPIDVELALDGAPVEVLEHHVVVAGAA